MIDLYKLIDYAIPLYCDNQSAICLAENPIFHAQTKHVECIITSAGKKKSYKMKLTMIHQDG